MALIDDLKDYISRNITARTEIKEKHNVVIVGETHSFLRTPIEIRTKAVVRLLLELLADPKYRYFGNESYFWQGPVAQGLKDYMRNKALPPVFDPSQANLDIQEVAKRVLVRRFQPVLDFIRANRRYILSVGSFINDKDQRDLALAQNFFAEFMARDLGPGDAGVLLVGARHAAAKRDEAWPTVHERMKEAGFVCVSVRVLTDFALGGTEAPDDAVFEISDKPLDQLNLDDIIRLTSLVDKTPVTVRTNGAWTNNQPSPFQRVTFGGSKVPVAEQFAYIVLQKA
jgi:hypothetical protein